ncbi:MAG TPA: GNAT family N-acetyltransferase [Chloroflexi bacterium]|nr:GNAT family N-acetyltransferase [Chloroflexota bacterium]
MAAQVQANIRPAREGDAPAITRLCGQLGYPASLEEVQRRLHRVIQEAGTHIVCVAEMPGQGVVGWVHAFVCDSLLVDTYVEIGGLIVDREYRRHGLGRRLMEAAEEWALRRGCGQIRLRSNVIREGAHRFYERLGYEFVKTQVTLRKVITG